MKKHIRDFCVRGMMFAWGGPVILAIIWAILQKYGTIASITVNQAVLGIITTTIMAFIASGISIVYQIESLPKLTAALIHMVVLYADYLGFYLLNGWIDVQRIWGFTLIFLGVFAVIWLCVYLSVNNVVSRINRNLNHE